MSKRHNTRVHAAVVWEEAAHVHSSTHVPAKEPTETEDSNIECWVCEDCSKLFRNSEGKEEITAGDTIVKYSAFVHGDVNGDNKLDSNDAIHLLRHMMSPERYPLKG